MLLPGFHPVLVGYLFVGGFGQRLDPAQVVERLLEFLAFLFDPVVHLQVGADRDRSGGRAGVLFVIVFHTLFHHHAAVGKTSQHVGHRLGQLAVHDQRYFKPVHVPGIPSFHRVR